MAHPGQDAGADALAKDPAWQCYLEKRRELGYLASRESKLLGATSFPPISA